MPNHPPARRYRWQATLIVTLFFIAVAGAAGIGWWYARESPPHQGPIVLISADGLAATLPPYGGAIDETPAIAALASDSVVFERAYAHSPQLLPAHASMLTGQLPPAHGVRDDAGFTLGSDARTLAELMRSRGFETGAAVSSFLLRRSTGIAQGFAFFDGDLPVTPDNELPAVERNGSLTIDAAERWLRSQSGQRSFMFVQVPRTSADEAVGRLVTLLKDRGIYDRSTIVFIGGRGDAGGGTSLDEAALRIPFLVKQPYREGAGRRIAIPVQQADLLPTLLDLVRAPLPGGLRGRSLRPLLDDGDGRIPEQPIYSESLTAHFRFGGHPMFALTTDRHRYVRAVDETLTPLDTTEQESDAGQRVTMLRASLDRLLGSSSLPQPPPLSAPDEDRLALLGYMNGMRLSADIGAISQAQESALVEAHRRAARLVGERKLYAGVVALQAIVRDHETLASVHYQIGVLLARSGRLDEAITAFRDAERLEPESADVALQLAGTLLRAGRSNEAQEQADLAVEHAGNATARELATAHEIAARAALELRDTDAANRHAQSAQDAEEDLPLPQFVRGRLLYNEGRYEEAVEAFTEAEEALRSQEAEASIADLHLYLGEALSHLSRYPEAEAQFREEIRAYPRSIQAYASLATLYRATSREAEIDSVIEELLDAVATPEGYAAAARLWTVLGDRSRADAIRADARTRFRGDPSLALVGRAGRR